MDRTVEINTRQKFLTEDEECSAIFWPAPAFIKGEPFTLMGYQQRETRFLCPQYVTAGTKQWTNGYKCCSQQVLKNSVFTHVSVMWNKLCQCTVNTISNIFVLFLQTILPLVNPATYRQCTRIKGFSAITAAQPSMVIPPQATAKATVSTLPSMTAIPTGQSTSVRNTPSTGSPSTPEVRKQRFYSMMMIIKSVLDCV